MEKSYKLGHIYTEKGGSSKPCDQFLRWINLPGSRMRNAGGIRALNFVNKNSALIPGFIILVSHEVKRIGNHREDIVDLKRSS